MENELKPCPFCGEKEKLQSGDNWSCGDGYVRCDACGGMMTADEGTGNSMEQLAITKWNTRAE